MTYRESLPLYSPAGVVVFRASWDPRTVRSSYRVEPLALPSRQSPIEAMGATVVWDVEAFAPSTVRLEGVLASASAKTGESLEAVEWEGENINVVVGTSDNDEVWYKWRRQSRTASMPHGVHCEVDLLPGDHGCLHLVVAWGEDLEPWFAADRPLGSLQPSQALVLFEHGQREHGGEGDLPGPGRYQLP